MQHLQRPAALPDRFPGKVWCVEASVSVIGPWQGQDWERCSVQERHRSVAGPRNSTVAAIGEVTGKERSSRSPRDKERERE